MLGFAWLAGSCSAAAADFQYPLAVVATNDAMFVADRNLPGVWSVVDGTPAIFFQGSKKFRTPLNAVRCLAVDREGRLIAGDSSTRQIYRFENGAPVPLLTTKTGIGIPMGIAVDRQGDLVVTDLETQRLCRIPANGEAPTWFANVAAPRGIAVDDEDRLWVVSHGSNQLVRVTAEGKSEVIVSGRPFQFPHCVAFDDQKTAYVSDGYAKTIWKIDASGKPTAWAAGEPLKNPVGIWWQEKRLLIADPQARALFAADREGRITRLTPEVAAP
ncbi:MAG TPA: SMP-30/gluconolactonase/LRE family protein [Planctomycetaceae bacterium]|nr:SMP-30/gluconolactonase/LRE family protein [Planctomycetaceae bacterium]